MSLRATEIAQVGEALKNLTGMPVHKVVQSDAHTVLLSLAGDWILLCVSADAGRLHRIEKPQGTGADPPAFCMLMRKYLLGTRLEAVRPIPGDRVIELLFSGGFALRAYLFGKSAQLQLVEGERLLGAIGPAKKPHEGLPPPRPLLDDSRFPGLLSPALDAAIEAHYAALFAERRRQAAIRRARAALAKDERLVAAVAADLARAEDAPRHKKHADLLLAHLHEIPRGASSVTVPDDFTDGTPLTIPLNPALSAKANAEHLYKQQRRMQRAAQQILARRDAALARIATQRTVIADLESGATGDDAVPSEATAPPPKGRPRPEAEANLPYHEFESATGARILVGKNAQKNDTLTFQVARGADLWLHTRDVPGSHVIVKLDPGATVDTETLVDAATLAAHYSTAKGEEQVDVMYTLKKHVRKAKGGAPGAVFTSETKTLRVRLEPKRLARLLQRPLV